MIPLGQIIKNALPFINAFLNDDYSKYHIETHLKWASHREWEHNLMPEIIRKWAVDSTKIILISCRHHDLETVAFEFESMEDLENHLVSRNGVLNPFITYDIPVIYGEVKWFNLLDAEGEIIDVDNFVEENHSPFENISLIWI